MTTSDNRREHAELERRWTALKAEYEQFRLHLPDALLEVEFPSTRVVYLNRVAQALLGYSEEDVAAGLVGINLLTPEGAAEAWRIADLQLEPTVRAGKPYERMRGQHLYDFTLVRKDGSTFPAEVQGSYVLDEHSMPRGVRFMFRDTTDRTRAAEALERSNAVLAALTSTQADFIRTGDPAVVFDGLLQHLLKITGSAFGFIGEVLKRSDGTPYINSWAITNIAWDEATRHFHDEHAATGLEFTNFNTLFGHAVLTAKPVIANDPANHPASGGLPPGHPPLNAFLGLPILAGGEVVGLIGIANRPGGYSEQDCIDLEPFVATCGTIIEARRNEIGRKEAEERLGLALRGADLYIWEWDIPGRQFITGFSPGELPQAAPAPGEPNMQWWLGLVHPDDRARLETAFRDHLVGRTSVIECEHRISAGPGAWGWVLTRGTVVERDAAGNAVRAAGSFLNITDRKEAEADLSRLEVQVRQSQKLESLGVFVGGIAHDFNNLLTAVLGNLYLLQRSLPAGVDLELADEAARAAERGADLVRRLLTYARPEVATGEVISLDLLLDETAALARSLLTPRIRLIVRHSRESDIAHGSHTSLQQVLLNLITNACDAMPEGGRVTLSRRITTIGPRHRWAPPELPRGQYHVISVADTGSGMTPEVVERIFDPFFTTKGVGRGTGLGLSTSLGIARAHGGWLTVESTPGTGSTFRLLLPVID